MTDQVLTLDQQGKVGVLTMIYRPYNLAGPTLYRALLTALDEMVTAGSRAVLIKSGLRHFCAGADVSLWDERIANQGKPPISPLEVLRGFVTEVQSNGLLARAVERAGLRGIANSDDF